MNDWTCHATLTHNFRLKTDMMLKFGTLLKRTVHSSGRYTRVRCGMFAFGNVCSSTTHRFFLDLSYLIFFHFSLDKNTNILGKALNKPYSLTPSNNIIMSEFLVVKCKTLHIDDGY